MSAGAATLPAVIAQQISFLKRQIQQATALQTHLMNLQGQLAAQHEPEMDDWLAALESMVVGTKYFTNEELRALTVQRSSLNATSGSEKAELTSALHELIKCGIPPESTEACTVAYRWIELLLEEVNGDEGMLIKLYTMHWHEHTLHSLTGIDHTGIKYISDAMAYRRLDIYAKYCLPDEMKRLRKHYVKQTAAWPPLIAEIRDCMDQGIQPNSVEMEPLVRQWLALSHAKTGGDPNLQLKLQTAFENEPSLRFGSGIDESLLTFIHEAICAFHAGAHDHNHNVENQ